MKRTLSLMMIAFLASMAAYISAETPVTLSELPKAAQTFLSSHFAGDNIRKAEKEQGRRGMEYEVKLISGAEVDFMSDGNWKEVKAAKGKAVPSAIVPKAIANYVSTNFKGQSILEISRKRGGYEVELSNGTELKLTEDAKPMPAGRNGRRPRN